MIVYFFTRPGRRGIRYLYCRLTHQGKSAELRLEYVVQDNDKKLSYFKTVVETELYDLFNSRVIKEKATDPQTIKQLYLNRTKSYYLLQTFKEYIDHKVMPRVNKGDIGHASQEKFECVYQHLKDFLNAGAGMTSTGRWWTAVL